MELTSNANSSAGKGSRSLWSESVGFSDHMTSSFYSGPD